MRGAHVDAQRRRISKGGVAALRLAVIGGTGVGPEALFDTTQPLHVETPYGRVALQQAQPTKEDVFFLARHGTGHSLPPHRINYRANMWALHHLGVEGVVATAAVGGLVRKMQPGDLVVVDSFIDFTSGRPSTFFDGDDARVVHTDMTQPYCPTLRRALLTAGQSLPNRIHQTGCYVCTNGPRYETPAEVSAFAMLGGTIVGMTALPEVVLARELGLCYATIALVTNLGAGLTLDPLDHDQVVQSMQACGESVCKLLRDAMGTLGTAKCHLCAASKPEF
jgi:5'-methylthioadenosine phosphorylase